MRVAFLLFEGFSNMVLSCLLEPWRAVRDQGQADVSWHVLTVDDRPLRSSSGLLVAPDEGASGPFDLLIVVAGYGFRDHASSPGLRRLLTLARQSRLIVGADTGSWLLAAAGLLGGHRATIHWSLIPEFAEAFPDVQVDPVTHVMQGRVWSCGGASAALDLTLALIADLFGKASAFIVSSMFLHDADHSRDGRTAGASADRKLLLAGKGSARLHQVIDLMVEMIETPLPLPRIAARSGLSLSNLERLFRAEAGMPPGRYFQMLRLARAQELAISTDLSLREIALRCGYANASALSKAFRGAYGHPIRQSSRRVL
ncbi:GlxA family transcriptional regulator [Paracoccus aerius]|uniref:Helix-turn-helix domain-containing protein n=1 Tax=Paracoccus aerius TaxID=1915382 RepID=A0ABS1S8J8_9RHOB|nr:helix-turn-helix domain-containing protein [Paracoccus aerius]MBL3674864.1 helix-turn-helix domain-containing protein [Paracoccus aerius]GHG29184.1 AraC family transcriptional regulator [Paracoccus aerius]